jgi:serine/threonine protein kinase
MDDGIRLRSQDYARRKVDDIFNDSDLEDRSHKFSKFQMSELVLGKELGRGAFGKACEIVAFKLPTLQSNEGNLQEASTLTLGHEDSRHFLARHCLREKGGSTGGHARYAMKQLLPSVVANTAMFIKGIADMAIETRLLSTLEHPNLIKLRATAACDPFQPEYFLIMDRLYDTLGDRLKTWEKQLKKFTGFSAKLTDRTGEKAANLYAERILAVFDLASAMEHLHGCRIVYRDLKPENIGFDVVSTNTIKAQCMLSC